MAFRVRPRYGLFAGSTTAGFADDLSDGASSVVVQGAVDWLY